jgi:hypothetical protein
MGTIAAAVLLLLPPLGGQAIVAPEPPLDHAVPGIVDIRIDPADAVAERDLRETRRIIEQRRESGELSRREARHLRREARLISALSERYGADGLSASERQELELRANELRARSQLPR